jgi:putative transposase
MPRRLRFAGGGYAYHVLNRAVGRARIFAKARDFEAFEEVIGEATRRLPMRVLAWCVLSNHWHFVLWPRGDGELSEWSGTRCEPTWFSRPMHGGGPACGIVSTVTRRRFWTRGQCLCREIGGGA